MSCLIRRAFTTIPPSFASSPGPSTLFPSAASSTRNLPQAVARRRKLHPPHPRSSPSPLADPAFHEEEPTNKVLPIKMELEFQHLRTRGRFAGSEAAGRAAFLKAQAMWRSRVRGVAWKKEDFFDKVEAELAAERGEEYVKPPPIEENEESGEGEEGEQTPELDLSPEEVARLAEEQAIATASGNVAKPKVVAHRIYLPNIIIRLVRNHTPSGQPYDPYIATFRIPPAMTKTDLRSYLKAAYNLDITFIRTDLYWGEVMRDQQTLRLKRRTGSAYNYKRAVVGLYEPFHYPDDVEELHAMGSEMGVGDKYAKAWEDELERVYKLNEMKGQRQKILQKVYKRVQKFRSPAINVGNTLRTIMERRKAREVEVAKVAKEIREQRLQKALSGITQ